jgi:alkylation response protein AidB-like acyl-CoA dehydrogenase
MMDPLAHLQMMMDRAAGAAPRGDLTRVRALRFTQPGFDRDIWRQMCRDGRLGMDIVEFCAFAEGLGATLAPEPLIEAAMAAQLLPPEHLAPVLTGDRVILPAWQETAGSLDRSVETTYRDGKLRGRKLNIPMAAGADAFLVTAADGLALIDRTAPGVSLEVQETQDGGHFGSLALDDAPAIWIEGDAAEALEYAIMAGCAFLLGVMDRALAITLDRIKAREAFEPPDGSLQALRHRVADIEAQIALTRSTVESAGRVLASGATLAQRQGAVSRARVRSADAAMMVARTCVQLYGGVGHTDASDIGLYWRKAMVLAPLYGSPAAHRARIRGPAA